MKLEFIGNANGQLNEDSFIYITKGEILKAYNENKAKAYNTPINPLKCPYEPLTSL